MREARPADVALIRGVFESANRRDMAEIVAAYHPDVTLAPPPYYAPPGTTYHGPQGVQSLAREVFSRVPEVHFEPREFRALGDRVLACVSFVDKAEQRTSTRELAYLYRISGGKILHGAGFATEAEAYKAAERPTEDHMRALFRDVPAPIVILDAEARFLDANAAACALLGVGVDALRDRAIIEFVPLESLGRFEQFLRALRDGALLVETFSVLSDAGERHPSVTFRASGGFAWGHRATIVIALDQMPAARAGAVRRLTPRQREVFGLLALGLAAPEIADRLCISHNTVRTHVQNGTSNLQAKTRVQAVALALARGEITLDGDLGA